MAVYVDDMRELPILFSAPMVRAILEGRKTVTRRVFAPERMTWPRKGFYETHALRGGELMTTGFGPFHPERWLSYCPYGQPGDRLWVRETFAQWPTCDLVRGGKVGMTAYRAGKPVLVPPLGAHVPLDQWPREWRDDTKPESVCWRPSIHMPRWASRLTLEVTGVRVERLQAISEADAIAEGIEQSERTGGWLPGNCAAPEWAFRELWESINGAGSWNANPWVWVVEFKRIEREKVG